MESGGKDIPRGRPLTPKPRSRPKPDTAFFPETTACNVLWSSGPADWLKGQNLSPFGPSVGRQEREGGPGKLGFSTVLSTGAKPSWGALEPSPPLLRPVFHSTAFPELLSGKTISQRHPDCSVSSRRVDPLFL